MKMKKISIISIIMLLLVSIVYPFNISNATEKIISSFTINAGPRYSIDLSKKKNVTIHLTDNNGISYVELQKEKTYYMVPQGEIKSFKDITSKVKISKDKKTLTIPSNLIEKNGITKFRLIARDNSKSKYFTRANFTLKKLEKVNSKGQYYTLNNAPGITISQKNNEYFRIYIKDSSGINLNTVKIYDGNEVAIGKEKRTVSFKAEDRLKLIDLSKKEKCTEIKLLVKKSDLIKYDNKYKIEVIVEDNKGIELINIQEIRIHYNQIMEIIYNGL